MLTDLVRSGGKGVCSAGSRGCALKVPADRLGLIFSRLPNVQGFKGWFEADLSFRNPRQLSCLSCNTPF